MHGTFLGTHGRDSAPGEGSGRDGLARPGADTMSEASRRAAREGVGRGLRALYAESLAQPLPDELQGLLDRFGPGA